MIAELPAVRVRAFTQGRSVPSSRFRVKALLEGLGTRGIDMHMSEALVSAYPPPRRLDRPLWLLRELLHRLPQVIGSYGSDVVILQRELPRQFQLLSFLPRRPEFWMSMMQYGCIVGGSPRIRLLVVSTISCVAINTWPITSVSSVGRLRSFRRASILFVFHPEGNAGRIE